METIKISDVSMLETELEKIKTRLSALESGRGSAYDTHALDVAQATHTNWARRFCYWANGFSSSPRPGRWKMSNYEICQVCGGVHYGTCCPSGINKRNGQAMEKVSDEILHEIVEFSGDRIMPRQIRAKDR